MGKEKFFIPPIEEDQIGPEIRLSEEKKRAKRERRERKDSLSKYILRWWKGDAHTHSKESTREGYGYPEGIYDIKEIMDYYKSLNLEFVCFAEHSSMPGSPEEQSTDSRISQSLIKEAERITAMNRARKGDIVALSGVETNIFFDENGEPCQIYSRRCSKSLNLPMAKCGFF
ncbi:hypothetical protein KKA93_03455 [Patescibacteria group bacterium]|nr:hypothetical protein [Patescibacteria group bacterium]MBU1663672.1 hypothetical protein [Patescibacteria group bacterium]MBU1933973.1 hypothetical protein [Patescibacteria group bacterium]MBU2007961.1 hypothetical protein [Patescibacteria group bacterium]MBU2233687.1 hypothetical protein [Patescibacteria group bacterium]